jgi:transmembrane sensor
MKHHEAIEATAAAWLAERDDGWSEEKASEFARWRAADPRHEAAVVRLENTWAALQTLRDFRPHAQRHPDRDLLRPSARTRRPRLLAFPAAAAVALAASLVVAAVWWFGLASRGADQDQSYITTVDGYQRIALPDGSLLELNANTEVNVRFTTGERRVNLRRGEAHFTVAKNPARPFWVEAGTVAVRAVGTAFNVRFGANDIEVLVTEGKVEIARESRDGSVASVSPAPVGANQRVVVSVTSAAAAIEQLDSQAIREALAWQGPRLTFLDTPLAEVVMQFNRHNQVQLELGDAELGSLPIGGSFRAENVDAFVRLLANDNEMIVDRVTPTRIVLRKAR